MKQTLDKTEEIAKEAVSIIFTISELFKYHEIVPSQVLDFLMRIKVHLMVDEKNELRKLETEEEKKVYMIFTRKTKGQKIYNPQFCVNK